MGGEGFDDLPVAAQFDEIQRAWENCRHLAIKSPTGSGKSIGLPLLLVRKQLVKGQILVVQPRRVAARLLARRVARLFGCGVGEDVGYQVRFENKVSPQTKIIYLTDGVLLQKFFSDPTLSRVGLIIFDEFHERSLQVDASFALAKRICLDQRPSLRLIVTSATLELPRIAEYLSDCGSIELFARSYPVEVAHCSPNSREPIWKQVANHLKKLLCIHEGDVLIFMDGAYEISRTIREINNSSWSSGIEVRGLYGEMRIEDQDLALTPSDRRKVIVSTNIAETSITVDGVTVVIDTGRAKKASFDQNRKVNVLLSLPISKSAAQQRTGRAGRTAPGYCLRLWGASDHDRRIEYEQPEIQRLDLSEICLKLSALGIPPSSFDWFEFPPEPSLKSALSALLEIGALSGSGERISEKGIEMSKCSLHPRLALALIEGRDRDCLPAIALTFAMLENRGPLAGNRIASDYADRKWCEHREGDATSDLSVLLNAYVYAKAKHFSTDKCRDEGIHGLRCMEAEKIATQMCRQIGWGEYSFKFPENDQYLKVLLETFPENLCLLKSRGTNLYETIQGSRVHLSRNSVISGAEWVLPLRIIEKSLDGRVALQMEWVSEIREDWIREVFGHRISEEKEVFLDLETRKVIRRKYSKISDQKFSIKESFDISEEEVSIAYANALACGDLVLKNWDAKVVRFLSRIEFLHNNFPEYEIVPLDQESINLVYHEICSGQTSWKSIRNQEVLPYLINAYGNDQLLVIDDTVPETIDLKNGKKPYRINYDAQNARVSVRLQDLYDLTIHPLIAHGNYSLLVDILAPNGRSCQLTTDLPAFWKGSYLQIKKELSGRYPKHEWR
jgi:ATP-dependent helicase HrpB